MAIVDEPQRRWPRRLFYGVAIVLFLFAALVIVVRRSRHGAGDPLLVTPNLVHEHNFITELYAMRAGGRVLVFDAGVDPEGRALDRALDALGARRDDVTDVYLTHAHFDHVAAAGLCPRARIHIGAADAALLGQQERPARFMVRVLQLLMPVEPVGATDALRGTRTDDAGVLAIAAPGHTPGSYFFYVDGVLFTGDSMQMEGDRLVGAVPTFTLDVDENRRSIAALGEALANVRLDFVCTGHAGCTPPGSARTMLDRLVLESR